MAFAAPLALATTLIGGGVSAASSIMGGQAQAGMYNYRAGVAKANQQIALQNENYESVAGETRSVVSGERSRFRAGQIASAQGASNLNVNTGSAPLVRSGQNVIAQQDQSVIRSNASRLAYGQSVRAAEYGAEADADSAAASNAGTAGTIGALSSLLSASTSVASKWYQGSQAGLFGGFGGEGGSGPEDYE